jgi:hypothetical protein
VAGSSESHRKNRHCRITSVTTITDKSTGSNESTFVSSLIE